MLTEREEEKGAFGGEQMPWGDRKQSFLSEYITSQCDFAGISADLIGFSKFSHRKRRN